MDKRKKIQTGVRTERYRAGISSLEFMVSLSVMLVVMTFVTSLTFHVGQVWRDIEQDRLAMGELSNQLDELTRQSKDDLIKQTANLKPSAFCIAGLPNPRLNANLTDDDLGQRIDLTLVWDHRSEERKVHLSGWAIESRPAVENRPEKSDTDSETNLEDEAKTETNAERVGSLFRPTDGFLSLQRIPKKTPDPLGVAKSKPCSNNENKAGDFTETQS